MFSVFPCECITNKIEWKDFEVVRWQDERCLQIFFLQRFLNGEAVTNRIKDAAMISLSLLSHWCHTSPGNKEDLWTFTPASSSLFCVQITTKAIVTRSLCLRCLTGRSDFSPAHPWDWTETEKCFCTICLFVRHLYFRGTIVSYVHFGFHISCLNAFSSNATL